MQKKQEDNIPPDKTSYYMSFNFEYGPLDDGTFWVMPPTKSLFHISPLTMRIVLELNSGSNIDVVAKKYELQRDEILEVLKKFADEKAIVKIREGKIRSGKKQEDIFLTPFILFTIVLCFIQIEYFKTYAATFLMKTFSDALLVGLIAVAVVFFHEMGHYIASRKYFKPGFGFTFLSIFPAVYVDTQAAWCLPKNIRVLINSSGFIADMLVNTLAIMLVVVYRPLEYFVTPFLLTQYTRLSVVLNPLISGDGYWIISDVTKIVNLTKRSFESLFRLRFNLLSLFAVLSIAMTVVSTAGFAWYLFNLSQKLFFFAKEHLAFLIR